MKFEYKNREEAGDIIKRKVSCPNCFKEGEVGVNNNFNLFYSEDSELW